MWNICPYFYLRATTTAAQKKAAKYQIKYLKIHKVAKIEINEIAKGRLLLRAFNERQVSPSEPCTVSYVRAVLVY